MIIYIFLFSKTFLLREQSGS